MKQLKQLLSEQVYFDVHYPIVETGFASIDRRIPLLRKGMLSILGGRPGMGKTTLALQIAGQVAASGGTVAFFTQEGTSLELSAWLADIMPIPSEPEMNLYFEDRVDTVQDLEYAIYNLKHEADLIIVDSLQEFKTIAENGATCYHTGKVCRILKRIADKNRAAVLCTSKLTRAPELRSNHWPNLNDIPNWDQFGWVIDYVCFMYREAYYNLECEHPGLTELYLARRVGTSHHFIGYLDQKWNGRTLHFSDEPYRE